MTKIECNHDIVISCQRTDNSSYGRAGFILAKELEKKGLGVLLTMIDWPRDTLYFHNDGTFTLVDNSNVKQLSECKHRACSGGHYLLGDGFILASDGIPDFKRKTTEEVLEVKSGNYYNLEKIIKSFRGVSVSGNILFYDSPNPLNHIDQFFNLINSKKAILAYDEHNSIKIGEEMAKTTGYSLSIIPFDEAKFAAIGFVEVGSHIIVDCRAEKTMQLLDGLGCQVFPTPIPLNNINHYRGSLRCLTREMPKITDKLKFHDYKYEGPNFEASRAIFSNTSWNRVIMNQSPYRKLRERICTDPSFSLN